VCVCVCVRARAHIATYRGVTERTASYNGRDALQRLTVSCPRYSKLNQTAKHCGLRRHFNRRDMIHTLFEKGASVSS